MVTNAYKAYLKSDRWKRKRQQVFAHYGKRCYACRRQARVLHVHHMSYKNLGREPMSDLIPLCVPCHREVTKIYKRARRLGLRPVTMAFVRAKRKETNQGPPPSKDKNAKRRTTPTHNTQSARRT